MKTLPSPRNKPAARFITGLGLAAAMTEAHCATCAAYEEAVMAARREGREPDPALQPCDDYVMSGAFQTWLVAAMRDEVMEQVSCTGLDRMAILRSEEQGQEQE